MDSLEYLKKNETLIQETPEQTAERLGFSEFSSEEIRRSYEMAGIHGNGFREFDETTGMMKDATRSKDMSEEDFKLGKARTMAMNNMKMAHYSMMDHKSDVVSAGHMSKEMRAICKGIDKITSVLGMTVDCTCKSKGKTVFDLGKYRLYIGNVVDAYDQSIEKTVYYLENKTPRTERGKIRYQFVRQFAAHLKREREAFSANAQMKEREMNAERAAHVNGGNILFDIRADIVDELEYEGGGLTKSAQSYTRNGKKYFYKEDREVEEGGITYKDSAQTCLYNLAQIPEHAKTDMDILKEKTATLILDLHDLFAHDSQFMNALLSDFASGKIDSEDFVESIHNRIVSWGISEQNTTKISDEIKKELKEGNTDSEMYKGVLQQVLNYNESSALATFNGIEPGRRLSARNVASRRVAEMLGCKNCIADSKTVLFTDKKGALKSGNSMEAVKGHNILSLIKKYHKIEFTGKAKRMICELQFVDFLCGQMDRHVGNYIANGKIINGVVYIDSIVGIDNDMSFGTFSYKDLKAGFNRLGGPESGGKFAMRKISRDLYMKIMKTQPEILKYSLADLGLSEKEFNALINRLKGIQSYLRRAYKHFGNELLVENDKAWEALSSEAIYAGEKAFNTADGTEMYQSIFGGIESNLSDFQGECHSL